MSIRCVKTSLVRKVLSSVDLHSCSALPPPLPPLAPGGDVVPGGAAPELREGLRQELRRGLHDLRAGTAGERAGTAGGCLVSCGSALRASW